jgi:hypothetical protein
MTVNPDDVIGEEKIDSIIVIFSLVLASVILLIILDGIVWYLLATDKIQQSELESNFIEMSSHDKNKTANSVLGLEGPN